ncbi:hypothetical protein [Mycobacterium lepromatosis]|uniref:hypothetical protein n=1 Tax=Mycobacterium lepromatosis TaxID=480418 RepID=UPI0005F7A54C|nr:hypothetical protein [Mycobacterium lepromatosis]
MSRIAVKLSPCSQVLVDKPKAQRLLRYRGEFIADARVFDYPPYLVVKVYRLGSWVCNFPPFEAQTRYAVLN